MLKLLLIPVLALSGLNAQNPFLPSGDDTPPPTATDTTSVPPQPSDSSTSETGSPADSARPIAADTTQYPVQEVEQAAPETDSDEMQTGPNPFLSQPASSADIPAAAGPAFDIQIAIERGALLSRLTVSPNYIETKSKPGYHFELGLKFPFKEFFHAGIALRYYHIEYLLKELLESPSGGNYQKKTTEILNYLAIPIDLGITRKFGFISPNLFIHAAPAMFVSGHYYYEKKWKTVYPDKSSSSGTETQDQDLTKLRSHFQFIYGGGAGCDIPYGYGIIYLKAGFDFYALDMADNEDNTKPMRSSSRLMTIFLSLGLKFFL